jgi:8-oxo-dGTP pyrophosphatase MutT (NUDIX family)
MDTRLDLLRDALRARKPARLQPPASRRAAVAVVSREGDSGLEILFIRRAEHPEDPWSGQMAFPGGRAEPGDADLAATAIRETLEETGLDLGRAEFLGKLDELQARGRLRPMDLSIQPFVFVLHQDAPTQLSEEVTSLHWIPLSALLAKSAVSTFTYTHAGVAVELPCLRVGEIVIWGLTYRMFLDLGTTLEGRKADP